MMNKEKLYNHIRKMFEEVANEFNFFKADFGSGYKKKVGDDIYSVSHAQIITLGVMDNKFEFSPIAKCTIMEVEGLWHDLYPLIISIPNENAMPKEDIERFKKLYPSTYSVKYDKDIIRKLYPNNIRETGWLCFDISEQGFEQFKEVLRFIIKNLLIPELEKYHSIDILDKMINNKIIATEEDKQIINEHQGLPFRRMILAKLNKNPLFEDICEYTKSYLPQVVELSKRPGLEYFKNYPFVFEEVYNRLKKLPTT